MSSEAATYQLRAELRGHDEDVSIFQQEYKPSKFFFKFSLLHANNTGSLFIGLIWMRRCDLYAFVNWA